MAGLGVLAVSNTSTYVQGGLDVYITDNGDSKTVDIYLYYRRTNSYSGATQSNPCNGTVTIDGESVSGSYNAYIPGNTNAWQGWYLHCSKTFWGDARNITISWSSSGYGGYFNGSGSEVITVPASYTNPSTPSVTLKSKTYNSATFGVSISSYGNPSDWGGRYIEAAILNQNSYGASYRYAIASNTTSATITVNNSSNANPSSFSIQGNHKYWYGGYASNTQRSVSTVTGSFYTPCPPLSALSLSSQSYSAYNKVAAIISYTRQSDGGAETRTGYYRYSTNGGTSYSSWTSFGTVSATSGTFTASLPTSSSITLQVKLTTPNGGDSSTKSVSFSTKTTHTAPNFSNFAYQDANTATVAITGDNQVFVQSQSQPKVTISAANKATANDGATITGYTAILNAASIQIPYSSSASVSGTFANYTPTASGTLTLQVAANDSLSLAKSVSKDVTVIPWSAPVLNATAERLNNFEAQTTLTIGGSYSQVKVNNVVKNTINVAYRAKKKSASWDDVEWISRPITVADSSFHAADLVLSFDNEYEWDIQVRAVDSFTTTTVQLSLPIGKPILFVSKNKKVSVNRKPQNSDADLDVEGKIYSQDQPVMVSHVGMVIMSTTLTTAADVKTLYGGNWTAYSGFSASGLYCWRRTS